MSLIRRKPIAPLRAVEEDTFCTLAEAAEILRLDKSTIRKREAGTEKLTHIRQGRPGSKRAPIFLIREEVLAHRRNLIQQARARQERVNELAYGT